MQRWRLHGLRRGLAGGPRALITLGVLSLSLADGGGNSAATTQGASLTPPSTYVFELQTGSTGECQGTSAYIPLISVKTGDYVEADTKYWAYATPLEDADIALERDAGNHATIWNPTEAANATLPVPMPYLPYQGRIHSSLVFEDSTFMACAGSAGYPYVHLTFTLRINRPPKPEYSTDLARQATFDYAEQLHAQGALLAQESAVQSASGRTEQASLLAAQAAEFEDEGDSMGYVAIDPPNTNYTVIAPPVVRTLRQQPYTTAHGLTQLEVDAMNALATNLDQSLALTQAILTAQERAWGAHDASDSVWEGRQRTARTSYMAQLSPLMVVLPGLLANLQAALRADGIQGTVTQTDIANFESSVTGNGLPIAIADALTDLGADATTQQRVRSYLQTENPAAAAAPGAAISPRG